VPAVSFALLDLMLPSHFRLAVRRSPIGWYAICAATLFHGLAAPVRLHLRVGSVVEGPHHDNR